MKIKHVYGNVLKLDIPLTIKIRTMEGDVPTEREEPFYPDVSKGCAVILGSSYNRKIQYDATVNGNVAHIEDDGVIGIGTYKVTVKCYDEEGNPYRYMVRDIIEICDATIDAGIEAGVEFNAETYTLEGAVFVSYGVEQVQSDWAETDPEEKSFIKNKPDLSVYATKEELSEVEGEIPTLPDHIVTDEHYVHTDNNYTSVEKEKLAGLENYNDSEIRQELNGKVNKVAGKGLSTNDFTNEDKTKLNSALQSETDPTVPQWAKQPSKPSYTSQEVGALPNSTKYGSTIDLAMDSATYVLTLSLKDQDGTVLNTKTVDLPIESVVVNGRYDAANKKIVLTLQSGSTIDVPVGDLIAGLQTEITSVNMLDADLVDDTNSTHKFVTAQEKQAWNSMVTSWQATPDNTHYPSEKLVKDSIDGVDKVFVVKRGTTSFNDALAAYTQDKILFVLINNSWYTALLGGANYITFGHSGAPIGGPNEISTVVFRPNNTWTTYTSKLTTDFNTTNDTTFPTTKAVADYAEKKTDIVAPVNTTDATLPITTLSCEVGKYYRIDVAVDTLAVTLPAVTDTTHISSIVFMLTTGTTPAVTFTAPSGINVYYQDGFEIEAGNTYEINALFNGAAWIVVAVKINIE